MSALFGLFDRARAIGSGGVVPLLACLMAAGCASTGWPTRSTGAPAPLDHPTVESLIRDLSAPVDRGYRFVVFGDQRALADGEWQQMMGHIGELAKQDPRLLFMIDTGDIVKATMRLTKPRLNCSSAA